MKLTRNVHAEHLQTTIAIQEWSFSPHRMRHVGFLVVTGMAELEIDGIVRPVQAPGFCWLPPGAAETLRLMAGGSGYIVSLDDDVCAQICERSDEALALGQAARRLVFAETDGVRAVLDELILSLSVVTRELRMLQRGSESSIAAHLELILLHNWRLLGAPAPLRQTPHGRSQTFERFTELVDQHFHEHWAISRFAETLCVTEDQLHAICTREAGRGPLSILHGRLIETARKRLETSIVPVEQVALRLGFTDAGYFNRFFKKRVGISPGIYRRKMMAQRLSERGEAFAAWP